MSADCVKVITAGFAKKLGLVNYSKKFKGAENVWELNDYKKYLECLRDKSSVPYRWFIQKTIRNANLEKILSGWSIGTGDWMAFASALPSVINTDADPEYSLSNDMDKNPEKFKILMKMVNASLAIVPWYDNDFWTICET